MQRTCLQAGTRPSAYETVAARRLGGYAHTAAFHAPEREVEMRLNTKPALATLLAATVLTALPVKVLAGPVTAANPSSLGLTASTETIHYRRYYGRHYPRRYHRGYSYDPGAAVATGVALGVLGAGVAAASGPYYGYPAYYSSPAPAYYGYPSYGGYDGW